MDSINLQYKFGAKFPALRVRPADRIRFEDNVTQQPRIVIFRRQLHCISRFADQMDFAHPGIPLQSLGIDFFDHSALVRMHTQSDDVAQIR